MFNGKQLLFLFCKKTRCFINFYAKNKQNLRRKNSDKTPLKKIFKHTTPNFETLAFSSLKPSDSVLSNAFLFLKRLFFYRLICAPKRQVLPTPSCVLFLLSHSLFMLFHVVWGFSARDASIKTRF
jgi:hypothetical protein